MFTHSLPMKDSPRVASCGQALRRDLASKCFPIESLKGPRPKYGVLVTCFSSNGGLSSFAVSSPVDITPYGEGSGSVPGKITSSPDTLGGELWGVVKTPEEGVTNVKELFVGSGDKAREDLLKEDVSW